ncbi:lactate dehydrogenase-like 2-hydroxyacid dehydrogenase [Nocardioides cavernae]|uniref:Lactate dehydrogenase-like 2-hydroxyacid dehydrogenase n=1 Tax=Nocardioides cavernae TaxID=1921566 RepID=A0A7Y9H1D5_9ACTN|nr:2-hydroxyacid dehydrogenase [Nocardioides cavernae]NYE36030.1 lactate dehydrogenase-like 2-hydroxyacid dehydrogenase [Nocardioides cavernae]
MTADTPHPVRVVQLGGLMPFVREWLTERYAAPELADLGGPDRAAGVEVAVVGGGAPAGAAEMDALPDLGAIVNFGVGYDNVDVQEASRRGIVVSNTPDVLTDAVADLAAFLVVDVLRGISAADRFVRSGAWARGEKPPLTRDVRGAVVGVLGLGRIGTAAAQRLEAFGAEVHYHSRSPKDVVWTYHGSPVELAAASDVLVVLTPGGAGTEGLVDAAVLDALGPDGHLVNVARGSVVDEDALVAALEEGRIAGAGLDVFADEPHVPEALLGRDDVVLLPHVGSATVQTREAMGRLVLDNVDAFLERGELVTPVG